MTKPEESFEISLEKLEKLVQHLESGDLALEASLDLFEEGMKLVKKCEKRLSDARRKVEVLVRDRDGKTSLKNFEPEE